MSKHFALTALPYSKILAETYPFAGLGDGDIIQGIYVKKRTPLCEPRQSIRGEQYEPYWEIARQGWNYEPHHRPRMADVVILLNQLDLEPCFTEYTGPENIIPQSDEILDTQDFDTMPVDAGSSTPHASSTTEAFASLATDRTLRAAKIPPFSSEQTTIAPATIMPEVVTNTSSDETRDIYGEIGRFARVPRSSTFINTPMTTYFAEIRDHTLCLYTTEGVSSSFHNFYGKTDIYCFIKGDLTTYA